MSCSALIGPLKIESTLFLASKYQLELVGKTGRRHLFVGNVQKLLRRERMQVYELLSLPIHHVPLIAFTGVWSRKILKRLSQNRPRPFQKLIEQFDNKHACLLAKNRACP